MHCCMLCWRLPQSLLLCPKVVAHAPEYMANPVCQSSQKQLWAEVGLVSQIQASWSSRLDARPLHVALCTSPLTSWNGAALTQIDAAKVLSEGGCKHRGITSPTHHTAAAQHHHPLRHRAPRGWPMHSSSALPVHRMRADLFILCLDHEV